MQSHSFPPGRSANVLLCVPACRVGLCRLSVPSIFTVYPDGNVCISILHNPGEDPLMYEQASERWSPVQSVEKVILSVISMLAGTFVHSFPPQSAMHYKAPAPSSPGTHTLCLLTRPTAQTRSNRTESGERCEHRLLQALQGQSFGSCRPLMPFVPLPPPPSLPLQGRPRTDRSIAGIRAHRSGIHQGAAGFIDKR